MRSGAGAEIQWVEEGRRLSPLVGTVQSESGGKHKVRSYLFSLKLLSGYMTLVKSLKSLVLGVLICKVGIMTYDTCFRGMGALRAW